MALEDPTFLLKIEAQPSNPTLALTEGSSGPYPPTSETGPAIAEASAQPEGTLKENPVVAKAFEAPALSPTPESSTIIQKVSPETTETAIRSSQTTTENSPSFVPQGPAIPETTPIVDGLDPSPSLVLREFAQKGQNGETAALETKPDSQVPPSEALSRTEKIAAAPILEGPPIVEADPVESNSQALKISAMVASPATSKEIPSDREIPSSARAEGLPDPEKTSPDLTRSGSGTFFLSPETRWKKSNRESPSGILEKILADSGGPEMNNLIRFQEDTPLGVIAKFPDQPRGEGVPADRLVEGPPKGSPEWIKEALSVYQQFSKGLLRTLQQGGDRIQMTLDPPQLGTILMEINRDRNFVTAHLWTDNPQTKELLDFSQGQLQKTLELDGFKLDRFEVLVQPDLKSFQEERWFGGTATDLGKQPAGGEPRSAGRVDPHSSGDGRPSFQPGQSIRGHLGLIHRKR